MRGTDKLNICETFYIYVGQWRTGRSRVCVTLQSSRNDKKSSIGSRSILVRFSIGSRSFFVRPSFCLRSSFVRQSKIYRKNNENTMEPQGNNLKAATNKHRMLRCALCAMLNVECWVLNGCRWQCWIVRCAQCWVLNIKC